MKVIIDIPIQLFGSDVEDKFQDFFARLQAETNHHLNFNTNLVCGAYELETIEMFLNAFKEMKIIPNNATNKDVFKAVFGYEPATDAVVCNKEDWCRASEPCNYCMSNPDNIGREDVWWNAPYKKEVEE